MSTLRSFMFLGAPLVALALTACATPVLQGAQTSEASDADHDAVLAVVDRAFEAINNDDQQAWREVLLDDGHFASVRGAAGERDVGARSFRDALANPADRGGAVWLERMWEPTVLVDGDMATVWTRYDFHIDGVFSHCGVDVIVLLRTDEGWKISSFAWSVERDGCPESPLGPVEPPQR